MTRIRTPVKLGEVLRRYEESIELEPNKQYRQVTVKLWGKGVVLRGVVTGAQVTVSRQTTVRSGQFILSRIDARNGAFGIIPKHLDGAIVTKDFPAFEIVNSRLDREYLEWMCKTRSFVEFCQHASEGTTNRIRLREDRFLATEVVLPPLAQQQQIASRIKELVNNIEEACKLRQEAMRDAEQIITAAERNVWRNCARWECKPLKDVTSFLARGRQSVQGESDHLLIKTQHVQQGRYIPTALRLASYAAANVSEKHLAQNGDILIACSATGCLGRVARYQGEGRLASTDTHVAIARPNPDTIDPDYLYTYLQGTEGQYQLRSRERGDWRREKVGFRLAELNMNDLREVPVPFPPRPKQRDIVDSLNKLREQANSLLTLHAQTSVELEALLTSILDQAFRGEL